VDPRRERGGQRHVADGRVAVSGRRGDGRARPGPTHGAVDVPAVAGRGPFRARTSTTSGAEPSCVVVAMAVDVDVDRQLVKVVDVVLVPSSTVYTRSSLLTARRI